MRARLKGDIHRRPSSALFGSLQRMNLCMRLASAIVKAFTDHQAVFNDNTAHSRVWGCGVLPKFSELESARHMGMIFYGEHPKTLIN